ncbi:MAG: nucleotide exchange factor GrpE [Bdellovibrionia bacterium]
MSNDEKNPQENSASEQNPQGTESLKNWQEEAEKFKNEYLYLRAEFENYKRHSIKERSDLTKFGAERFIRDLLEAVDNFDRALSFDVNTENFQTFVQGVKMTQTEIRQILQKHGVTEVASDKTAFDPAVHEALGSEPSSEVEAGYILRTFKKAYKLHDKLIRPAQVVVASKPQA